MNHSSTAQAIQFHFHWARDMAMGGSEHTIDGNFYYGELHIVHVNTASPDVGTALSMGDGLAVLGFFVDVSKAYKSYILFDLFEFLISSFSDFIARKKSFLYFFF